MDGTEDNLFQMFQDDSDDDDPFEGFDDNGVEQNAEFTANILSTGPEPIILDTLTASFLTYQEQSQSLRLTMIALVINFNISEWYPLIN